MPYRRQLHGHYNLFLYMGWWTDDSQLSYTSLYNS